MAKVLGMESRDFQSHLGLISTDMIREQIQELEKPFNPILVWFQPLDRLEDFIYGVAFNPILVWFQQTWTWKL